MFATCRVVAPVFGWPVLTWLTLLAMARADEPPAALSPAILSPAALTERIDALLERRWQAAGQTPAPLCADAEFHRRLCLDLLGRAPRVAETRAFLADGAPDKRRRLVERLLAKPEHANYLAVVWRRFLIPESANVQLFGGPQPFDAWLRERFAANEPYDAVARDLLTASGPFGQGPVAFYTAVQAKPEELAGGVARGLLGVQIECAQCHDHPFDQWTRREFWQFAAFFARLPKPQGPMGFVTQIQDTAEGELRWPDSDETLTPRYLGGPDAAPQEGVTRRRQLAAWLTAPDNRWFARAAVNRAWWHLFGRGLVEPVDNFGDHNPPTHPELLDELARWFAASNHDLRGLLAVLANTRAYQLSSRGSEGREAVELYARRAPKPLGAEELYDSLRVAALRENRPTGDPRAFAAVPAFDAARQEFVNQFRAPSGSPLEYQGGVPQALALMNGVVMQNMVAPPSGGLAQAATAPFFTDEQRVELLFVAALARQPTPKEQARGAALLAQAATPQAKAEALGDLLWAMLNTAEFALNH